MSSYCTNITKVVKTNALELKTIWGATTSFGVLYSLLTTPCIQKLTPSDLAPIQTDVVTYFQNAVQDPAIAAVIATIHTAITTGYPICFEAGPVLTAFLANPSEITTISEITNLYTALEYFIEHPNAD